MILIAESGSTKTDWRTIDSKGKIAAFQTEGLNPVYKDKTELCRIINLGVNEANVNLKKIKEVHFYGAGCMHYEKAEVVEEALKSIFTDANCFVESDILAAARSLSQNDKGIVAILGTGANVCVYDGSEITYTRSGLGFILGDEGSGAHLGKVLIKKCLDDEFPEEFVNKMFEKFDLTKSKIIDAVYRQPNPNLFLSRFSKYIFQNKNNPEMVKVIVEVFKSFFETHILKIDDYKNYTLHLTGSVAFYYADFIKKIAKKYDVTIGKIVEKPIAGLALYHMPNT